MDPTAVSYSLWLMPDPGEVQERLDNLVERMARELNAPRFDFHVTLLGGIKSANLPELKSSLETLAGGLQPFDVFFGEDSLAVYDTWNQSVLLLAEETAELKAANLAAQRVFTDPAAKEAAFAAPSKTPHGSLLYGPHGMEERQAAEKWVRQEAGWILTPWSFKAKRIVLYETETPKERRWEGVPTWKKAFPDPCASYMFSVVLLLQVVYTAWSVGLHGPSPPQSEALLEDDECQSPSNSAQCALNALQIDRTASEEAGTQEAEYNSTSQRWVLTLYHQTSHSAGKSILKHGFRAGHVGWCGAGIYFAMSAAATSQKIKGPDSHGGYMIEARVDVGRVKHMPWHCTTSPSCNHHPFAKCQDRTNRGSWLHRQGYDSINFQPDPYGQEYVIFDKSRVVSMRGYSYHR